MIWMPSDTQIVQALHVFVALTIIFGLRLLKLKPMTCCLVAIGFALVKEFTFDLWVEGDSLESSLFDFAWYVFGTFLGLVALRVKSYYKHCHHCESHK
jgi:hypothetical protein